jgi:hypothetical protein
MLSVLIYIRKIFGGLVMFNRDFPHCCTATVVCDFPTDKGFRVGDERNIKAFVREEIKYRKQDGDAILVATLTTQQEKAKKILIDSGWNCVGPFKKGRHKERDLYLLHYVLNQPNEVKTQPRDAKGRFIKANPFK